MTLMERRRALMANGEAVDPTLVYELKNRTFSNDGSIDTGIAYLTIDKSFTIMCDADFAGQQNGQSWRLFTMMNGTSPWAGIAFGAVAANSSDIMVAWMTKKNPGGITIPYPYVGNVKVVLTHSTGSGAMTYYVKVGENTVATNRISSQFTSITPNLAIGGSLTNTSKFNGTVNKFALYDTVKSSAEINTFLA